MYGLNQDQKISSTWRELKALYYTLQGLQRTAAHKNIKWFMDNRGLVSILRIGSRKRNLHALAIDILDTCQQLHCTLHTQWVPRDRNWLADELSRGSISKLPDYGSEAVDAFSQDWSADNNWFCPPVSLIAKVLQQCAAQQARVTLIAPYWPSDHRQFHGIFKKGNDLDKCVFDEQPLFDTLALRIDFRLINI